MQKKKKNGSSSCLWERKLSACRREERNNCFSPYNLLVYCLYCVVLILKKEKEKHIPRPTLDLQGKVYGWGPIMFIFNKFPR